MTPGDEHQDREQFVELSALAVFVSITEAGTLTAAAKKLGLTQSAVSQVLKQVEMALGVVLIDRSTRPFRVTPAGLRFKVYAENMLLEARKISAVVRESAQTALPKIRLGLIDSFASTFGPQIVKRLHSRAEHLTIWAGYNAALRDALLGRRLDLIVTTDPLASEEGLECHELFRDPFVLIIPAEYEDLTVDGLRGLADRLPLVRYSRRSSLGVQVDVHLRRLGLEPPDRFEFDSSDTLLSMVSSGFGWALTTTLCLLQARHAIGRSQVVPLPGAGVSRRFNLIARRGEHGDMPRQVAEMCREVFRETVLPEMQLIAPWIGKDAYTIDSVIQVPLSTRGPLLDNLDSGANAAFMRNAGASEG